ncbi:MAG TPA: hypothetical protein VGK74_02265 [Symbiobacteriaceae bacterium]|jgi:hypothetical protein
MQLGLPAKELETIFENYLNRGITGAETLQPPIGDYSELVGFVAAQTGRAVAEMIEANNRQLKEQLRALGVLPPNR